MKKVLCMTLLAGTLLATACKQETKAERYAREARETSAQCPMAIDVYTTMDSMTYAMADNSFSYHYTVSSVSDSLLLVQRSELEQQILLQLKNAPEMRPYIEDRMTFRYIYRSSETGNPLMEFVFTPEVYLPR